MAAVCGFLKGRLSALCWLINGQAEMHVPVYDLEELALLWDQMGCLHIQID